MADYFFRSSYRWLIISLVIALIGLWYYWFKTDQIVSSVLVVFTTGVVLLNIGLGFFSYERHRFVTRLLYFVSAIIICLAAYTLLSVSQGVR